MNQVAQLNFPELYYNLGQKGGKFDFLSPNLKLGDIISPAINYIFVIAGLLLLVYLIYGGFHFMISVGDPKGMQEAQGKITNALAGFLIIFLAYWIVQILSSVLGLQGFRGVF